MSDTPDGVLDELTRILAHCDQVQVDIDNARKRFEGIERIQRQLDDQQVHLDAQTSRLKIAKRMIKRNLL